MKYNRLVRFRIHMMLKFSSGPNLTKQILNLKSIWREAVGFSSSDG